MNANIYAMRMVHNEMAGEWEKAGIHGESEITELCREVRAEVEYTRFYRPPHSSCRSQSKS
jgi:hypothetical protein